MTELKAQIQTALMGFASGSLAANAKALLNVLGYKSDRTVQLSPNTLIGIEKPAQMLLRNPDIDKKEKELKEVRERHFTARTPQTKEKYRKADERLRAEISELLKQDGFPEGDNRETCKLEPIRSECIGGFF